MLNIYNGRALRSSRLMGHALTRLLLAVSFFFRGFGPELNGRASFFAFAGGVTYLLFMVMAFIVK